MSSDHKKRIFSIINQPTIWLLWFKNHIDDDDGRLIIDLNDCPSSSLLLLFSCEIQSVHSTKTKTNYNQTGPIEIETNQSTISVHLNETQPVNTEKKSIKSHLICIHINHKII